MQMPDAKDSRKGMLDILKKEDCSIKELCEKLGLSPTAVRQHITILERDALVKKKTIKEKMGRPKYVYSLTEKADQLFPKGYDNFLEWILEEIIEFKGYNGAMDMMERIAKKNASRYKPLFQEKNLIERLEQLVNLLNEFGAYAEYSKEKDNFVLKTFNCIFSKPAIKFNPIICRYDMVFFESFLGKKIAKRRSQTHGEKYCFFEIKA